MQALLVLFSIAAGTCWALDVPQNRVRYFQVFVNSLATSCSSEQGKSGAGTQQLFADWQASKAEHFMTGTLWKYFLKQWLLAVKAFLFCTSG